MVNGGGSSAVDYVSAGIRFGALVDHLLRSARQSASSVKPPLRVVAPCESVRENLRYVSWG